MVGEGYGASERNGNQPNLGWTTDDGGCLLRFVGGGRFGDTPGNFPPSVDGGPAEAGAERRSRRRPRSACRMKRGVELASAP